VRNSKSSTTPIYELDGMLLAKHFSMTKHTLNLKVSNFTGLLGLVEKATSSLFLEEGVHSLWNRNADD